VALALGQDLGSAVVLNLDAAIHQLAGQKKIVLKVEARAIPQLIEGEGFHAAFTVKLKVIVESVNMVDGPV